MSENYISIMDDIMQQFRQKPELFIGEKNILLLKAFLDGYFFSEKQLQPLWVGFQKFVEIHFGEVTTLSWAKIVLKHSASQECAVEKFFTLYDEWRLAWQ